MRIVQTTIINNLECVNLPTRAIWPCNCHPYEHMVPRITYTTIKTGLNNIVSSSSLYSFHNKDISSYYTGYVRIVLIINKSIIKKDTCEHGFVVEINTRVILSDKYFIYNSKNIDRFNLRFSPYHVDRMCLLGDISLLESLWDKRHFGEQYAHTHGIYHEYIDPFGHASNAGHVNVLEWLKNNEYLVFDSNYIQLGITSEIFKPDVINWWKNSGLLK